MTTAETLHARYNRRSDQIPPVRIKGFTRGHLAGLFNEFGFKVGAEVGVAEGKYSIVLCEAIPNLHLLCVDLWDTYYRDKQKLKDRAMQDWALDQAKNRLAGYDVEFIRAASMEAVRTIPEGFLDFVYIDADHAFDFVMQDIIEWSRRVKPGGIVAGHDAYRFRGAGVVDAVSVYTHCHQINEWFLCDEREVSFFWAKP